MSAARMRWAIISSVLRRFLAIRVSRRLPRWGIR
jgi:hypothetical protein